MNVRYALDDAQYPEPSDSGYTHEQLDALAGELIDESGTFDAFALALEIGLSDGDVIELTETGTVLLQTPRHVLDARIDAIRASRKAGTALAAAVEMAVSKHPD